jgi:glycosyltransferase involved in cell wall biosynthesis
MPGKYNKKTVYSIRTTLSECPPLYRIFEKLFYGKSFVVTNSLKGMEEFKMIIGNRSTGNLTNIYNGFDIKRFTAENPPEVSGTLVFGTAGRQTAQKNQIQILRVLNRLKNTLSFHFYLIGEKYTGVTLELEKYISDNNLDRLITILDPISRIEEYYKKFNLFILSSKSEGCSNVLFEAMLSKCLCIVSKEANTDNFIKEGWNGLEYDGSDEDLERKINKAVQIINSGEVHKITHNGYAYASENFSMEKMVEGYEEIYRSLLADNAF